MVFSEVSGRVWMRPFLVIRDPKGPAREQKAMHCLEQSLHLGSIERRLGSSSTEHFKVPTVRPPKNLGHEAQDSLIRGLRVR